MGLVRGIDDDTAQRGGLGERNDKRTKCRRRKSIVSEQPRSIAFCGDTHAHIAGRNPFREHATVSVAHKVGNRFVVLNAALRAFGKSRNNQVRTGDWLSCGHVIKVRTDHRATFRIDSGSGSAFIFYPNVRGNLDLGKIDTPFVNEKIEPRWIDGLTELRLIGAEETLRVVVKAVPVRRHPNGEIPIALAATLEERRFTSAVMNDQLKHGSADGGEGRECCLKRGLVAAIKEMPFAATERWTFPPTDARLEIGHRERALGPASIANGFTLACLNQRPGRTLKHSGAGENCEQLRKCFHRGKFWRLSGSSESAHL